MSDFAMDEPAALPPGMALRQFRNLLARYLRPQAGRVVLMVALLLGGTALQLANPQVIRYFLDTAQTGGESRRLMIAAGLFIAFAILQQGLNVTSTYFNQLVAWTATNTLRADLTLHCLRLDLPFHKVHTPGALIERIDGDVTQLANFFSELFARVLGEGLLVVGILALLFRENVWVGLGMVGYTLLTMLLLGQIQKIAVPRWKAERQAVTEMFGFLEERISGAEEIRAAGAEAHMLRRLYGLMRMRLEKTRIAFAMNSISQNLTGLVYVTGYAVGLALAVMLYTRGQASLGGAYLLIYYIGMLDTPLQNIRRQIQDLQQSAASIQRVSALFDLRPTVADPAADARPLPGSALAVEFDQVTFRYDDHTTALEQVNFTIQPGRVLGILGRTGSGKSTLTRLLFRLYDPGEGSIRLGGVDLRQIRLEDLRRRVGMVTQDVQLFQATVCENLTFFNGQTTDEALRRVLTALGLWGWVESLPNGLDSPLAAGGAGLSAGEAQLLAFTRVFLKDPGLVVLDEASSRLDPATEALLERAVTRLLDGRTGVVIAHRLKTVQRADDILILENGRVVEYGARETLARDPQSRFARLLQVGMEEALA